MLVKIFCCYAHEDEPLLKKFKTHLRPLQREGLIELWYDRDISAGAEWEQEIILQLNAAQIILLLVSPDFMDSDYSYDIEMKRAMERHERGEAQVIPIIVRPVYWRRTPFGKLQALPSDAKPVTDSSWHNLDEAFFNVAVGIRKAIEKPPAKIKEQRPDEDNAQEVLNQKRRALLHDEQRTTILEYQATKSVFFFNQPLPHPNEFFGRVRERYELINDIREGYSISIIGPRRIGKTWLIDYLRLTAPTELGSSFRIGYINPYQPGFETLAGFRAETLRAFGVPSSIVSHIDLNNFMSFEDVLRTFNSEEQTLVLCIDGFDGLLTQPEFPINRRFMSELRFMGVEGLLRYVVANKRSIDLDVFDAGCDRPDLFTNLLMTMQLNPFSKKDAEAFVHAKSKAAAGFTEQESNFLLEYGQESDRQWLPLRLQLVGKLLEEDKNLMAKGHIHPFYLSDPEYRQEFEKRLKEKYEGVMYRK